MEFTDTGKDNAYLSEDAYDKAMVDTARALKDGYIKVPDWFPVPLPGYKYQIFGQMTAVMKPKPKLRHILRYKFSLLMLRSKWRDFRCISNAKKFYKRKEQF